MRRWTSWMGLALTSSLPLLAAGTAGAQSDSTFEIRVEPPAPAGCPDSQELTEAVAARTGRSAAGRHGEALSIQVQIETVAEGHRARVTIVDANARALGSRELSAGACTELEPMLVLVIASSLGVSPESTRGVPPPQAAKPAPVRAARQEHAPKFRATPEPPREAEARAAVKPVAAPGQSAAWTTDLELTGLLVTGLSADPSAGAGLGLWLEHGAFALRAAGSFVPARWLDPERDPRLELTGAIAEVDACTVAVPGARAWLAFCAGVQAGALYARAQPLHRGQPRWDGLLSAAPSARLRVRALPGGGFSVGLGATIPLIFPRYSYVDAGGHARLHAIELGMFAELALWLRFGS